MVPWKYFHKRNAFMALPLAVGGTPMAPNLEYKLYPGTPNGGRESHPPEDCGNSPNQ
jgi:hypothetical protein